MEENRYAGSLSNVNSHYEAALRVSKLYFTADDCFLIRTDFPQ